jgi:hypothetical protein
MMDTSASDNNPTRWGKISHWANVETTLSQASSTNGRRFNFICQSPDLNILDLGLFHSLKCKVSQLKQAATNIDQLIAKVKIAYTQYEANTLIRSYLGTFVSMLEQNL